MKVAAQRPIYSRLLSLIHTQRDTDRFEYLAHEGICEKRMRETLMHARAFRVTLEGGAPVSKQFNHFVTDFVTDL